nr:RHS repeat-associated core domain-containing protein [Xenorhabdus bovienii]
MIENAVFDPGLKFAGQWLDEESGLFYNRFRYYSPLAGCYLTPDPIGIQGGENTYGYVPNPTGFIDPLGLAKKKPKEDQRRPAPEVPKVKEETYKIVRHVSTAELENIKKAGGKLCYIITVREWLAGLIYPLNRLGLRKSTPILKIIYTESYIQ